MLNLKRKNNSGLTLVEILIATLILVVFIGVIYGLQNTLVDLFHISQGKADLQAEGRLALALMSSELKNATRASPQNPSPNLTIPSKPNNNSIIFYMPKDKDGDGLITDANGDIEWATNEAVHYQYVPGQKELRRLKPDAGGPQKLLARNVLDVQFIDSDIDPSLYINEVKIILALKKTTFRDIDITLFFTSIVQLRN